MVPAPVQRYGNPGIRKGVGVFLFQFVPLEQ